MTREMPVLFAAHGAPMLLDDAAWMRELADWAAAIPRPRAILMISAHWEASPVSIGATSTLPLIYDFFGFPERYYEIEYTAPGAPELAERVRTLLRAAAIPFADAPSRGLDHGVYVPLIAMYPGAEIPVLQLSLPRLDRAARDADGLVALGQALAPLRSEGVLIFGSGFLIHNMEYAFKSGIPDWAREFDEWAEAALSAFDLAALADFPSRAPHAWTALPTWEHYAPVLVAAGAAARGDHAASFPITGFWMNGAFTRRSVQLG
jgi:4,5-DOPA dioxygenase extradiol